MRTDNAHNTLSTYSIGYYQGRLAAKRETLFSINPDINKDYQEGYQDGIADLHNEACLNKQWIN